jgi:hypothetical protein
MSLLAFAKSKTISKFVADSLDIFLNKPEKCFDCERHRMQIATLELSRQRLAAKKPCTINKRQWVRCNEALILRTKEYAQASGRSLREITEQAVLEHLTRPVDCFDCPIWRKHEDIPSEQLEKHEPAECS